MFNKGILLVVVFWGCLVSSAIGRDAFEVESHRLGDGTFQYRLRTLHDPVIKGFTFHQLIPYPFLNYVESTPPPHWTNVISSNEWWGITFDYTTNQPRTNEILFTARSSSTHFRRQQNAFINLFYLEFAANYNDVGGSVIGYVTLDCLVPCSPEQADGSSSKITSRYELVKDIKIDELLYTNRQVHGLKYSWNQKSTVELEGSHNLKDWNFIGRIHGEPGQTTWTTNSSLNPYGKFFRLAFVANSHISTGTAARTSGDSLNSIAIPLRNVRIEGREINGEFESQPGRQYEATLSTATGKILETRSITATQTHTTVRFDTSKSPEMGYVRILEAGH